MQLSASVVLTKLCERDELPRVYNKIDQGEVGGDCLHYGYITVERL